MLGPYELNKIYNEDSYSAIKQIPDHSVDCVYTDIPYLYSGGYNKHKNNVGVGISQKLVDELAPIISGIDYKIYEEFIRIMKKVNIFIWLSSEQILPTMNYFSNKGYFIKIIFWGKTNPQPLANNSWLSDTEYCLYIREKGVTLNDGYDLKKTFHISPLNKRDKELFKHPTIKPLDMVKQHLLHTTKPGDLVVDFFIGSGTTAVASKETGRNYIGFELNMEYFKIAKNRVKGITANGQTSIFTFMD